MLHVVVALAGRSAVLLFVQTLKDLLLDRTVSPLGLKLDVQTLVSQRTCFLSRDQAEVVLGVKLAKHLYNELFAQLLLFVVFEVSVEDEAEAAPADHVVAQVETDPLNAA